MTEKTKAAFRAVREECGFRIQDVADDTGYTVMSVKRWENPSSDQEVPDVVWEWLMECRQSLYAEARHAADEAIRLHRGDDPVVLAYYRTQDQLDGCQLDAGMDRPVGYVNAITREVARILEEKHLNVVYAYPADDIERE